MQMILISLVIWWIVGVMTFASKEKPTKFQYGIVWFCLILELIKGVVEKWN